MNGPKDNINMNITRPPRMTSLDNLNCDNELGLDTNELLSQTLV